jgi:putative endonuclease
MHFVYILYSISADKYNVGETKDLSQRLFLHSSKTFKKSATKIADEWEIYWSYYCGSLLVARRVEKHIKQMKSRKYYQDLKQYPDIINKLIAKFKLGSLPR